MIKVTITLAEIQPELKHGLVDFDVTKEVDGNTTSFLVMLRIPASEKERALQKLQKKAEENPNFVFNHLEAIRMGGDPKILMFALGAA